MVSILPQTSHFQKEFLSSNFDEFTVSSDLFKYLLIEHNKWSRRFFFWLACGNEWVVEPPMITDLKITACSQISKKIQLLDGMDASQAPECTEDIFLVIAVTFFFTGIKNSAWNNNHLGLVIYIISKVYQSLKSNLF